MKKLHGIFLVGGLQTFRRQIAYELSDTLLGGQAHSFASPIREGAVGTFFLGDPSIDIEALATRPILSSADSPTFGQFAAAFAKFLEDFFSDASILGHLAAQRLRDNLDYFNIFIFDDADNKENIRIVADLLGRQDCLIVNFDPKSRLTSTTIQTLDLFNCTDQTYAVQTICDKLHLRSPTPRPLPPTSPLTGDDLYDLA